jgi:hypothetical protein
MTALGNPPMEADELSLLRMAARSNLANAKTPEEIDAAGRILSKVVEIEKQVADTEKAKAEREKLGWDMAADTRRSRSDERKHFASLLAPLFTTIVLAGTLALQAYQATTTERDKQVDQQRQREAAEDARWSDTLKSLSGEIRGISPGSLSLITFFASPRYSDLAKKTATAVLVQSKDIDQFRQLFNSSFGTVDWPNLNDVLDLDRDIYSKARSQLDVISRKEGSLTEEETQFLSLFYGKVSFLCGQIAPLLKSPRPSGASLNLSSTGFYSCDLSHGSFENANLTDFYIAGGLIFDGATFKGVTGYKTATWANTAWWRALAIDPDMLAFLKTNFAYNSKGNYWPLDTSQEDYNTNIRRLETADRRAD